LLLGKYKFLDPLMKAIVLILTISSVIAVFIAGMNSEVTPDFSQVIPSGAVEVAFLIAFLGWMPAPLDVSIWQSLWTIEKQKGNKEFKRNRAFLDFNIGYVVTIFIGVCFIALGNFVMHNSGMGFGTGASEFASQLIQLYTENLGDMSGVFIAVAAFTTMFSTTITTLDASPRSMAHTTELIYGKRMPGSYLFWVLLLAAGTMIILSFLLTSMIGMVKIATIISFLTAPFYALANYILINSRHTPAEFRPNRLMKLWSILGIVFLIGFSIWYLITLF
jgi:Mn2+/Fe2+ NRAMP family transporter